MRWWAASATSILSRVPPSEGPSPVSGEDVCKSRPRERMPHGKNVTVCCSRVPGGACMQVKIIWISWGFPRRLFLGCFSPWLWFYEVDGVLTQNDQNNKNDKKCSWSGVYHTNQKFLHPKPIRLSVLDTVPKDFKARFSFLGMRVSFQWFAAALAVIQWADNLSIYWAQNIGDTWCDQLRFAYVPRFSGNKYYRKVKILCGAMP